MGSICARTCFILELSIMRHSNARINIGMVIIILLAIIQNVGLLIFGINLYSSSPPEDTVKMYEKHFEGLKSILPSQGVMCYITDDKSYAKRFLTNSTAFSNRNAARRSFEEQPRNVFADSESLHAYCLTQYALAPLILVNATDCEFVVGNFNSTISIPEFTMEKHMKLIKDMGNGVMLFRRESR